MTRMKAHSVSLFFALAGLSVTVGSCKKDNDDNNNDMRYNLSGNADGAQEAPMKVTTSASGTISGHL